MKAFLLPIGVMLLGCEAFHNPVWHFISPSLPLSLSTSLPLKAFNQHSYVSIECKIFHKLVGMFVCNLLLLHVA